MFHNLSHNSSELSPDSGTLLARDHLVKMKFSPAAASTAPQHHLSLSLYLPSFFMLLVSSSFLNPVCFPPQIESQWPVDFGGTRNSARWSANQPTYYGVVTSLLAPPFIQPTAAPNWSTASQCFSGVRLPASCYWPWPLTCQHPSGLTFGSTYHREEHLLCGPPPASRSL